MNQTKFKGNLVEITGKLPEMGSQAPDFVLVKEDLSEVKLSDFKAKYLVFHIFPSLDTGVCATSVKKFNEHLQSKENVELLCISKDLPFAQKRFCNLENLNKPINLSDFRDGFLAYGLKMTNGSLKGLLARAVIVLDKERKIIYKELVEEITTEPNYEKVLEVLK
jgi:thioredoxin-dependent peroxiredoxin